MFSALAIKSGELIFIGAMLSLGFWVSKKLTNKIDTYLFMRTEEYQKLIKPDLGTVNG